MDILSIMGLVVSTVAILGGNYLEGGHIDSLSSGVAFMIVAGGTLGAIMLQFPMNIFMLSIKVGVWVFIPPKQDHHAVIEKIVNWSNIARKEGLLGLETISETETDEFAKKGLQLLVDGSEPETIRNIMEVDLSTKEFLTTQAAKVYEAAGGYTPTLGIIGSVLGLIHVMNNLADPSKLGSGIAVAFIATVYGVVLANLVFLPMGIKLKLIIHDQSQFKEMIIEGVIAIAEGENPRNIETKLQGYLH